MRSAAVSPFIAASATALLTAPALLGLIPIRDALNTRDTAARSVEFIQEVMIDYTQLGVSPPVTQDTVLHAGSVRGKMHGAHFAVRRFVSS